MIYRRMRTIAILLAILALVVAACGPQATEEPTEEPAETEVATEEPTEEPAETEEAVDEATEEATDEVDAEATEEAAEAEATEEATDEADAEAAADEAEATEEATDEVDAEATEEAAEAEATEEATDEADAEAAADEAEATDEAAEATEEAAEAEATEEAMDDMDEAEQTIVDIVVASTEADEAEFTALLAAVQAADPAVAEALSDPEAEFTVFAPTDEAFAALLEAMEFDSLEALVEEIGVEELTNILLYHVVEGAVFAETVVTLDGEYVPTLLDGDSVLVSVEEGPVVMVDNATVVTTDIEAANGVIHVIDTVLVPDGESGMDDMGEAEATEEAMDDMGEAEATEEAMDDMGEAEATEEAMDDMGEAEATEEAMDEMSEAEATEEAMDDMGEMEATEEAMDDMGEMEATEEAMDDMGEMDEDVAMATYESETFSFEYPEDFDLQEGNNVLRLTRGEQVLVVVAPEAFASVIGDNEFLSDMDALIFYLERTGYTVGEASDMMMAAASVNVELPRRGEVGIANLVDLGEGNYGVVIELAASEEERPGAEGGAIMSSMVYTPPVEEEPMEEAPAEEEAAEEEEATEEAAEAEATEEATEEAMDDMGEAEATEEAMDDMGEAEATEEAMDDMGEMDEDVAMATYESETFSFEYPENFDLQEGNNVLRLTRGEQVLVVVAPEAFASVIGDNEFLSDMDALIFYLERTGYTVGEASDMMMAAASVNVELPRRGEVGIANLVDLGEGNYGVVIELAASEEERPGAEGGAIMSSMVYTPPVEEEPMEEAPAEEAAEEEEAEATEEAAEEEAEATEEAMDMEATEEAAAEGEALTIVGLAIQNENLSSLANAVVRAQLFSELNGEGPFTVFAPTNAAIADALEAQGMSMDELLAAPTMLRDLLLYHVVEGAVTSDMLEDGQVIRTLNGGTLTVNVTEDGVTITDSGGNTYNVVTADVMASNGVIHVIDGVLVEE